MKDASNKAAKNATANAAKAGNQQLSSRDTKDSKNRKTCFQCQRKGHFASDCYATKLKDREELSSNGVKPQLKSKANVQQATENLGTPENLKKSNNQDHKPSDNGRAWKAMAMEAIASLELPPGCWIVNSGASHHMTPDRSFFVEIQDYSTDVCLANGKSIKVTGISKAEVCFGGKTLTLKDVLYVPELDGNLLLLGAASKNGVTVEFELERVLFKHQGNVIATANQHSSVYILKLTNGKVAFKVQTYQKSMSSMAAPATAGGAPPILGLTPEPVAAVPEQVGGSHEAPASGEALGPVTPEIPNFSNQPQTDYWKWH